MVVSCTLHAWPTQDEESARGNHVLALTLPNIHRFTKIAVRLSNKPFLICLLTISPHLQCVATLPCNLLLMACFADITVSQCSVATYARCGGVFNVYLTANLPRNLPLNFFNQLRFDGIMVTSLWPNFLAHPVYYGVSTRSQ